MTVPTGAGMAELNVGDCLGFLSDGKIYTLRVVGTGRELSLQVLHGPTESIGQVWRKVRIVVSDQDTFVSRRVTSVAFVNMLLQVRGLHLMYTLPRRWLRPARRAFLPVDEGSATWASAETDQTFLGDN